MTNRRNLTRREFLLGWWFPFFWRRNRVTLDGIPFQVIRRRHGGTRYLLIHGNEETAREVLTEHMRSHSGVAHLVRVHTRWIKIESGRMDPNRIFSREGAEKNLRTLNPGWSGNALRRALDRLDRGREKLVRAILPPPGALLIAVHNNSEGYSVHDETAISDRTALHDAAHPHEFFLCTQTADFEILAAGPYNVVLQNRAPREDDGSLSRLAARRGVRYVNLEVGRGNQEKQREMLNWAVARIAARPGPPVPATTGG
ncbi:MAG: hypothetical protein M1436_03660 [Acidobacteria bacterium]|nr:hypothetical protein [Acidobacteriota bacterium]